MKLPKGALLCQLCSRLAFEPLDTCPDCGGPLGRPKKRQKYGSEATTVDGVWFQSKKEARRWGQLRIMEAAGEITGLRRQPKFVFVVHGYEVGSYKPDFSYYDKKGIFIVEDVKSTATRTEAYGLRKRLLLACHGVEVTEV